MFVQTVRIPVLEFSIALIPGRGFGLLHPWKREIATFRYKTLEHGPETVQHPGGFVLSEDESKPIPRTSSCQVRRHGGNTRTEKLRSIRKHVIDRGHVK